MISQSGQVKILHKVTLLVWFVTNYFPNQYQNRFNLKIVSIAVKQTASKCVLCEMIPTFWSGFDYPEKAFLSIYLHTHNSFGSTEDE